MLRRRIWSVAFLAPAVLVGAGYLGFKSELLPNLTRFPTDLKVDAAYEGTFTLYIDPATRQPLSEPKSFPLAVTRHVEAVAGESSADTVVVKETLNLEATGLFDTTQQHQYVMDRETHANVADTRSWSYTASNIVDRSGTNYVSFGLHLDTSKPVMSYKDEFGSKYTAVPAGTSTLQGVRVGDFDATLPWAPVTTAYLADLSATMPLPADLTFDQMKPLLAGQGLNVDALLGALVPKLAPADIQALLAISGAPIPLSYLMESSGRTAIDATTGAPVDVRYVSESLGAVPAASWVTQVTSVLSKYPQAPEAVLLSGALTQAGANPIAVFHHEYHQTPASVASAVSDATSNGRLLRIVETWVPWTLLVIAGLLGAIGLLMLLLPRRREVPVRQTGAVSPVQERIPAPVVATEPGVVLEPEPATATTGTTIAVDTQLDQHHQVT